MSPFEVTTEPDNLIYMRAALQEAEKCHPTPGAFCVGCVLVVRGDNGIAVQLAAGYSREFPGNTHAEANALRKARELSSADLHLAMHNAELPQSSIEEVLQRCDVYTTMEPCSVRTSGLAPCADALKEARVRRCLIGVKEPDDFVACQGAQILHEAGIAVIWVNGLENDCLLAARRGHQSSMV